MRIFVILSLRTGSVNKISACLLCPVPFSPRAVVCCRGAELVIYTQQCVDERREERACESAGKTVLSASVSAHGAGELLTGGERC